MACESKMQKKNNMLIRNKNNVRSITPCLVRKDELSSFEIYLQKIQTPSQQNQYQNQNEPQTRSQNKIYQELDQGQGDQLCAQNLLLQAQGIVSKDKTHLSTPAQAENILLMYQDIFKNENNRFRSLTPNNRWSKQKGMIRSRNENQYIINQLQNKTNIANQNKDLLIMTNYWEKKQQESQQSQYHDNNQSNCSPLPSIPLSSSPINLNQGSHFLQDSKSNLQKQNYFTSPNNYKRQQDSPYKKAHTQYQVSQVINKSQGQHQINLQDSPLKNGGETAHFNNYLQDTIMKYIQQQPIQDNSNNTNPTGTYLRNSIFENSFLAEKQKSFCQNSLNSKQRSVTPSPLSHNKNSEIVNNNKTRRQLKLNKSNINFFAEQNIPIPSPNQNKRIQTQPNESFEDNLFFIKYNDENIFNNNQNSIHPPKNTPQQNVKVIKKTLQNIVLPDNQEGLSQLEYQNSSEQIQFSIKNVKNHLKNPSVVQFTPKSTMRKYSKVQRFIPIQNRIIRYPAFVNIMHNTTRDQTFSTLKKNKLIKEEEIKNFI
ncbi:hypothetical protein TTHERM_00442490 (macronuclear) [Tetrahymena thermophila SB210]|uniref:Uncharacterized protein n=1 Tax=Tetrahymena thermophila (strain SB210) TaxID=312017 RepID=I7MGV4_TETTS|nr:hypothetical protein TTHERM_00442490 [Tetrahymena thermophila SB210]EAR85499.1 hypothetical protein TTHERM_00442490 [Tetrahymena thermophila SB210]|eukprot:XP_001033162.1 hypothetical protein TTHERM_00442490 [Tetrahymena thermophila SB210]